MTIYCRLAGGLGNQLFQIAKAEEIASPGERIYYSDYGLAKYDKKRTCCDFISESPRYKKIENKIIICILELRIPKIINLILKPFNKYEKAFKFFDLKIIDGYYQEKIHTGLEIVKNNCSIVSSKPSNAITIHIRGSDAIRYFNLALIEKYYEKALEYATKLYPDSPIIIVTEDVSYATCFISSIKLLRKRAYEVVSSSSEVEDFIMLSSSALTIAAPSTFSWWAGFCSNNSFITPGYFLNNKPRMKLSNNEIQI
jgi:hypothetical protein